MKKLLFLFLMVIFLATCDDQKDNPLKDTKWFYEDNIRSEYLHFKSESLANYHKTTAASCYDLFSYSYSIDGEVLTIHDGSEIREYTFEKTSNTLTMSPFWGDTAVLVLSDFNSSDLIICDAAAKLLSLSFFEAK